MTNIVRKRGDTVPHKIEVVDKCNNAPLDVTGYGFLLTVDPEKEPTDDLANIFQLVGSVTDGAAGLVEFPFTVDQADNVGDFFYDIQMTDGAGKTRTIEAGKWTMKQDITK